MTVTVEISGVLRRPKGPAPHAVDLPPGATPAELYAALGYNEAERRVLRLSRSGVMLKASDVLEDGDRLVLIAAIGGG